MARVGVLLLAAVACLCLSAALSDPVYSREQAREASNGEDAQSGQTDSSESRRSEDKEGEANRAAEKAAEAKQEANGEPSASNNADKSSDSDNNVDKPEPEVGTPRQKRSLRSVSLL